MSTETARGSEKLVASLVAKGSSLTAQDVKTALHLPVSEELNLLRYFPRGIPAFYDEFEAVFEVPTAQLASTISSLSSNHEISAINVLRRGIPPIYHMAEITTILKA